MASGAHKYSANKAPDFIATFFKMMSLTIRITAKMFDNM